MTTAFWDRAYARRLQRSVLPRSKIQRAARAEAKAREKFKAEQARQPLDPSRPIPAGLMWFALSVKSRCEFQEARYLESVGWFTLVPTKEVTITVNGKRGGDRRKEKTQIYAELSGFVFAALPYYPDWTSLEGRNAIYGPLATQGTPLIMSEREAARFQQNAALSASEATQRALMADRLVRIRKALEKGGKAKVVDGPFASFEVTVQSVRGDIARGSVKMFGGDTSIEFHLDQLEAA